MLVLKALVQCACYVLKASRSHQLGAKLVKILFAKSPMQELNQVPFVLVSCVQPTAHLCSTAAHGWHRVWVPKQTYCNFTAIYRTFFQAWVTTTPAPPRFCWGWVRTPGASKRLV